MKEFKEGTYILHIDYKPFVPSFINENIDWKSMNYPFYFKTPSMAWSIKFLCWLDSWYWYMQLKKLQILIVLKIPEQQLKMQYRLLNRYGIKKWLARSSKLFSSNKLFSWKIKLAANIYEIAKKAHKILQHCFSGLGKDCKLV